jgi:hypothetical protein
VCSSAQNLQAESLDERRNDFAALLLVKVDDLFANDGDVYKGFHLSKEHLES